MSYYNNSPEHPWDDGVYGTGRTKPPKNHGGLICVLLILVIFLSGLVTFLGIMNIRMVHRLNEQEELNSAIAFAAELPEAAAFEAQSEEFTAEEESVPVEEVGSPIAEKPAPEMEMELHGSPEETEAAFTEEEAGIEARDFEEPAPSQLSLQDIYERSIPSVVSITCRTKGSGSSGTGVILSHQGYIVTNYHVIEHAGTIHIQLTDDRVFEASVVGSDAVSDLAVLMVEADGLVPAEFGSSDNLRVGDSVVAIGDPLGVEYRGTMTNGIISAINRDVTVNGRTMNLIQTDAALNSGNSGGPLINSYGQVIGINTMKIGAFTDNAGVEGLGFAIPSTTVKDIVDQIIAQGYVSGRPSLGLMGESISLFYQRYYRLPSGLYISEVTPGSNAEKAGIEVGDILMAFDGERIYNMSELTTMLYQYSAGDVVKLIIYRGGGQYEITLELEEARG